VIGDTYLDLFENKEAAMLTNSQPPVAAQPRKHKRHTRGIQAAAVTYMHTRLGLHTTIQEAWAGIGDTFPEPITPMQVGQALSKAATLGLISRVASGVYVYRATDPAQPSNPPTSLIYETVGSLPDGTPVVRSEEGIIGLVCSIEAHFAKVGQ
jgi:hypothetical protein